MTYTNSTYLSTNSSLQVISNFSLPLEKSIRYNIVAVNNKYTQSSIIDIVHNGITTAAIQNSMNTSALTSMVFSTEIYNNVGRLTVSPSSNSTSFAIIKQSIDCVNFGDSIQSGYNILGPIGFGYYSANSTVQKITIRQPQFLQTFTDANTYIVNNYTQNVEYSNTILSGAWQSRNGATVSGNTYTSSGQPDSYMFQQLSVEIGQMYRISGNVTTTGGPSNIFVIDNLSSSSKYIDSKIEGQVNVDLFFTPTSNTVIVGVGNGKLNSSVGFNSMSVKRAGPFHTYDHTQGTFVVSWRGYNSNSSLIVLSGSQGNHSLQIVSGQVLFDNIVCGPELDYNNVRIYNELDCGVIIALNQETIQVAGTLNRSIQSCMINSIVKDFTYTTTATLDTTLTEFIYV